MTLRARLLVAIGYVLLLALVVLGVPLALNVTGRVDAEVRAEASGSAHLIAATASGRLEDVPAMQALVDSAAQDVDGRVIVVDREGALVADSAGEGLRGQSYAQRPEIRTALVDGVAAQGRRQSDTLGGELLVTAVPIVEGGQRVGAVRISQGVSQIDAAVRRDLAVLAGIAAAALAVGLALAWFLADSLARPLRGLAGAARRMAAGDLTARAEVTGSSEQQDVAAAFNDMAERVGLVLEAQRDFAANASHQLRTPLTGLRLRLEAASMQAGDPALRHELEAAELETERLARLLTGLLTLAREGGERPLLRAPVPLAGIAERALDRWGHTAEASGHRLELRGEAGLVAAIGEEDAATAIDNLIENALAYAPSGTVVAIERARRGDRSVLAVVDGGPGSRPRRPSGSSSASPAAARGSARPGPASGSRSSARSRAAGAGRRASSRPTAGRPRRLELPTELQPLPTPNPALGNGLPDGG
ncbi:MAG: HAMP domain-containing protein [Thermoleophilia bacterium]